MLTKNNNDDGPDGNCDLFDTLQIQAWPSRKMGKDGVKADEEEKAVDIIGLTTHSTSEWCIPTGLTSHSALLSRQQ